MYMFIHYIYIHAGCNMSIYIYTHVYCLKYAVGAKKRGGTKHVAGPVAMHKMMIHPCLG